MGYLLLSFSHRTNNKLPLHRKRMPISYLSPGIQRFIKERWRIPLPPYVYLVKGQENVFYLDYRRIKLPWVEFINVRKCVVHVIKRESVI
jgi:hypothetical protein